MYPLELGELNIVFVVLGVVALGGVIVGLILVMMRRSSAMSDEISQQSKAKFDAITPTSSTVPERPQAMQVSEKTRQFLQKEREANTDFTLRKELLEIKFRLDNYAREATTNVQRQIQTQASLVKVEGEVAALRDQLSKDGSLGRQDLQKLKTSLAEQSFKLNSQRQDLENQRKDIEKIKEKPELEKLKGEIAGLKDQLLTAERELQKLRTSFDERNMNIPQVQSLASRPVETPWTARLTQADNLPKPGGNMVIPPTPPTAAPTRTCIRCGSPINPQDNYCDHCGQAVS